MVLFIVAALKWNDDIFAMMMLLTVFG